VSREARASSLHVKRSRSGKVAAVQRFALVVLSLVLSGCLSRKDALAPIITIYDPPNGASRSTENLIVRGYVMDDQGISSILINTSELLDSPIYQAEKGKKLIQFSFRIPSDRTDFVSTLVVRDMSGRETLQNYQLRIDNLPPTLELNPTISLSGNRLRISGTARDDDAVKSIVVGGYSVPFIPSLESEQSFSVDIDIADNMTIEISDRAGNLFSQAITP
jgi:hypothetical protein